MQSAQREFSQHDEPSIPPALTGAVNTDGAPPNAENDTRFPVTFTGSGGEYFRIWIVNVLLSILTLYVYSAWAKVRTQRYFAGNTVLEGSAFEYHARGLQIFLGRIVAVVLVAVVMIGGTINPLIQIVAFIALALALPWAVWRSLKFSMRMTSYRNVRFGFEGSLGQMYINLIILPLAPLLAGAAAAGSAVYFMQDTQLAVVIGGLSVLAAYLLSPFVHKRLAEYTLSGFRFGRASFVAKLSTGRFYAIYLKAFLVSLLTIVVVFAAMAVVFGVAGIASPESLLALGSSDESEPNAAVTIAITALYLVFFLASFLVKAYFHVRIRQHLLTCSQLDGRVNFESTMRLMPFLWLQVSNLLLFVITLGLAYPWTKVRSARYEANHTVLHSASGLYAIVDDEHAHQSSLGEEIGDAFDMDMDVGF